MLIQILNSFLTDLKALEPRTHDGLEPWATRVSPFIRENFPNHWEDFEKANHIPRSGPQAVAGSYSRGGQEQMETWLRNSAQAAREEEQRHVGQRKLRLLNFLEGLITICPEESGNSTTIFDAKDLVIQICDGFPRFLKQLSRRYDNRTSIEIRDEYDIQDLFHALLKLHFVDVRSEEHTPSHAGKSSRMDFLIKKHKIVIELKMTRPNLKDGEVGKQLIEDCQRYAASPDCETLVCYVYDPDEHLVNPNGLEIDLSRKHDGKIDVEIRVSSSHR